MRRTVTPELLDSDAGTPQEIDSALADLRWVNRWFGGVRTMRKLLEEVATRTGRHDLTLLDVAAGSGDIAAEVTRQLGGAGIRLQPTLLDRSSVHMEGAEVADRVVGDALALPFCERSFDVVACSLFLHHLEPAEAVKFLTEALRVCRVAVLISDLRRSRVHLAATHLGKLLYRSRLTRHDAPASVARAYTGEEILRLAAQAQPVPHTMVQRSYWLFRSGTILFRPDSLCLEVAK